MTTEEFFMYLTIGLILVIPISVRIQRYLAKDRTARMVREQFGNLESSKKSDKPTP
jgi:hypothetical protein